MRTPCATNCRASRVISSKLSSARVRQVRVVLVEHFLGHAVAAAEVAAVGDADAQVAQRPAQRVGQQAGGGRWRCAGTPRGQRGDALVDQGDHAFGHRGY